MTSFLDRLNLRPGERRLVVGVALILFVVLNVVFVWPYFSRWSVAQARFDGARGKLQRYDAELAERGKYESLIREFERENADVPAEDQAYKLLDTISAHARQCGVVIMGVPSQSTKTNDFFVEQSAKVRIQSDEDGLVKFLYNLGEGQSLVRARGLSLHPLLPARHLLEGDITLVASYQRNRPTKPAATAATAPKPAPAVAATNPPATRRSGPATAAAKPATNAPAAASWWSKAKGWFGSSSTSTSSPAAKSAASTNRPPMRPTPETR